MPIDDIVEILRQTDEEKFGAERLRSLLKLLPDDSEVRDDGPSTISRGSG